MSTQQECLSCGKPLTPEAKRQKHAPGRVPECVESCWECWTTISADKRILLAIAFRDRLIGGVLAEMAAALDRLDQSRHEDEPGEDWKRTEDE